MARTMLPTLLFHEETLPESFVRGEAERPKVAHDAFSDEIPVISLAKLVDDDASGNKGRGEVYKKIVEACEAWGVFQVVDHGVDQDLMDEMLKLSREFFALPAEEKLRYDMSGGRRGGYLISSHLQEGMKVHDWREFMTYFTYPVQTREYKQWPDKPKGWPKVVEDYSEQLMGLATSYWRSCPRPWALTKRPFLTNNGYTMDSCEGYWNVAIDTWLLLEFTTAR